MHGSNAFEFTSSAKPIHPGVVFWEVINIEHHGLPHPQSPIHYVNQKTYSCMMSQSPVSISHTRPNQTHQFSQYPQSSPVLASNWDQVRCAQDRYFSDISATDFMPCGVTDLQAWFWNAAMLTQYKLMALGAVFRREVGCNSMALEQRTITISIDRLAAGRVLCGMNETSTLSIRDLFLLLRTSVVWSEELRTLEIDAHSRHLQNWHDCQWLSSY